MDTLHLDDQFEDKRGKMFFFSHGPKKIAVVETKQGYARGGHYHEYEQDYIIISGKFEHREEDMETRKERVRTIKAPYVIHVQKNVAQLFVALEDSIFSYTYQSQHKSINYSKYRNIVEEKMTASRLV